MRTLKPLKVGQVVRIRNGYTIGYDANSEKHEARVGTIVEQLANDRYGIYFSGYKNTVDFARKELAIC